VHTRELRVETGKRPVTDVTGDVESFCSGLGDGLPTIRFKGLHDVEHAAEVADPYGALP